MMVKCSPDYEADCNEKTPILEKEESGCLTGLLQKRYIFRLLGFLGFVNVYAMRVNLSVALVAMVYTPPKPDGFDREGTCANLLPYDPGHHGADNDTYPTMASNQFNWDSKEQSDILGAFFYGYVITQIPGGILAEKYGAKWFYCGGILVTSVFTLLTPWAAEWGFWPLFVARFIEGLGEGVTYPAVNVLIGKWSPEMERSRTSAVIFSGSAIGTVVSMALSGILSATYGWEWVFYLFGFVGVVWCVPWLLLVHESPETHPTISDREKAHIMEGRDAGIKPDIPYKAILSSGYVWILAVTHFGQGWGFYTLLTEMPTYLSNVLHFDLKQNGLISAVPYLVQAFFAVSASMIADKMRATGKWSITRIRKIFNSLAFFIPGVLVLLVGFAGCQPAVIVVLLTMSVGFNGLIHAGFNVTHVDMSRQFAGFLMAVTNFVSNFSGFLAPRYVGWMTERGQTLETWRYVFVTTASVFCIAGIIFDFFGTAEKQPWGTASPEPTSSSSNESSSETPVVIPMADDPPR
ncbi:hypothetical protein JTE90_013933 [Oedothorax gibbosus]|uniref:Sialin n=1 Tax=Oedothorax gibbosus TaxID=931172 RepID=A0AAV6U8P1_9ARAC|nr:hypothetical protein JTE90_013933 [Oedothorax gibbosus]